MGLMIGSLLVTIGSICCTNMSVPCSFGLSGRHAVSSVEMKNVYLLQECNAPSPSKWRRNTTAIRRTHGVVELSMSGASILYQTAGLLWTITGVHPHALHEATSCQ